MWAKKCDRDKKRMQWQRRVQGRLKLTTNCGNGSEFFWQKVEKSALRIDYSEIKILRPQIREIWEFSKTLETKHLYFLYIFCRLQNGPFYTSKRPILLSKMNHFAEQNGPFCDVKWVILKKKKHFSRFLSGSFTQTRAFVFLEWRKKSTGFFGKKCL